jgi:hypothetical protein
MPQGGSGRVFHLCHAETQLPDGTDRKRAAGEAAWFKEHPVMTAEIREN